MDPTQPVTGLVSCWATLIPPWPLHPSVGAGGTLHRHQASRATTSKRRPPSPCPPGPPGPPSVPVQGHHSTVLQGQEHHRGWGIYWCCPKIEVELQRGEERGDLADAVWSREMVSETGLGTGWGPSRGGWLGTHLPTGGNWRIWDSGAGVGQHFRSQAHPCLLHAPPGMGRNWGGDREPLL